jgi:hypothetical protein
LKNKIQLCKTNHWAQQESEAKQIKSRAHISVDLKRQKLKSANTSQIRMKSTKEPEQHARGTEIDFFIKIQHD